MTHYGSWREVPPHMLTATKLGELEFPRTAKGIEPAGYVDVWANWRGKPDTHDLYDARTAPITGASGKALLAAAGRSGRSRVCTDCGAHCERPVATLDGRGLCDACRHITLLRVNQAELAVKRERAASVARAVLAWEAGAVVQVDLAVPPLTEKGRARPATAGRIRAVDMAGVKLLDILVRMVGPRASWVPDDAVPPEDALPKVKRALAGRRLVAWHPEDFDSLRSAEPECRFPSGYTASLADSEVRAAPPAGLAGGYNEDHPGDPNRLRPAVADMAALVWRSLASEWRGELHPRTRELIPALPPGSPDRLWLMLRRMADCPDLPTNCDGPGRG